MKTFLFVISVFFSITHIVVCIPCKREASVDIGTGEVFSNGSIVFNGLEYYNGSWYETENDGVLLKLGCPCILKPCLWKCCKNGQAHYNRSCKESNISEVNPFSPQLWIGKEPIAAVAHQNLFYFFEQQLCEDRYLVDTSSNIEEIYIQENGTLFEVTRGGDLWHSPGTFCVDMMVDDFSVPARMVAIVCYPEVVAITDDSPILYIAYAIGLLLSVPFLLATFIVYAYIPELRNLHGMCLMAYCAGLIIAYPFLAYLKLNSGKIGVAKTGCLVIAFIVYYAFQTSFFWLNVMCFDIWRTFSGYRGGGSTKRRERKRFALYGAYAWGVPALLTICTVFMQFAEDLPENIIRPRFGEKRCWFIHWLSEMMYFFIPVLVLVFCNVVLFSVTAHRIRSIKQETAILKSAESSRSDKLKKDKQRYALYLKLFMVMGVNWTVELISFAVGGSNWYWMIVDVSNIALGFLIFMIFVWKNKVRNLLRKRLFGRNNMPSSMQDSSNTGRWATRSSSAPTEDTRVSADESAIKLKDMH